jgi:hypothetical protein
MGWITKTVSSLVERIKAVSKLIVNVQVSRNAIVYTATYEAVYANDGSIVVVAGYGEPRILVQKVPSATLFKERPQGDTIWQP